MNEFKKFLAYFKVILIIEAVILVLFGIIVGGRALILNSKVSSRTNTPPTSQRVFDDADVLSDSNEAKLEELINKRQDAVGCDIVLVTMDEPIDKALMELVGEDEFPEYITSFAENFYSVAGNDIYNDGEMLTCAYSELLYDVMGFGYDERFSGVMLLDNYSREYDGQIHTWLVTTGTAYDRYYTSDVDRLLDRVYTCVEDNPYKAYKIYIDTFYNDMAGHGLIGLHKSHTLLIGISFAAALVFVLINIRSKAGRVTTNSRTYLEEGTANFSNTKDVFLRKNVVSHHIDSGGGGSGGGGSHGGGGGSHGGGGHSR